MTRKQENRLSMYLAVNEYLTPNNAITSDLPEFESSFIAFQNIINEINKTSVFQLYNKTGIADEKRDLREKLILLVEDNSLKLQSYAGLNNNVVLFTEVRFTRSKLNKSSYAGLTDYAQIVYDKAQENLEALGSFRITQKTQAELLKAINEYNSSLTGVRLGSVEKSQATRQLVVYFAEAERLLRKMDSAINIISIEHQDFYSQYRDIRRVFATGTGKLALKALATEENTGMRLKGVTFVFSPDGKKKTKRQAKGEIVKKTAKRGGLKIKHIPEGTYTVKVTKTGYKEQEVKISVASGEMTDLRVELEKV